MTHHCAGITFRLAASLVALLAGCASSDLYSGGTSRLPLFKSYSGEDAAHVFVAYRDNFPHGLDFHESGSSMLVLDGQRITPSPFLSHLKIKPGRHAFKLQGRREIQMAPEYGYDPENYPKRFFSRLVEDDLRIGSHEVQMLLMFWDHDQYSYFAIPLGTADRVKRFPAPEPGTTMKLGSRQIPHFILEAFHDYSVEIAERLGQ